MININMNIVELLILAVGLSMDAFAVAVCLGLSMPKSTIKKALIVGLYFGIFQACMPLIGYYAAKLFAGYITGFDHWIAVVLLGVLGLKMIIGSFKKEEHTENTCDTLLSLRKMLPLAIATSIDALAVGISLAVVKANIFFAVIFIGIITFVLSMVGVKIGNIFGKQIKSQAEILGGVILILIGLKILFGHLGIISF